MNLRPQSPPAFGARVHGLPWVVAAMLAAATRFVGLGDRAVSHDESLHAWYSWVFAETGRYAHDPVMHGPLLFHADAVVFRVLGDTDTTARLVPALAGLAVAAGMLLFRRWLGRAGSVAAAALALASPTLLFYSRYLRNDVYMALFALVWVYGLFRYLERPRWIWLAVLTAGMALSFACKETAFITGAIFGGCLAAAALWAAMAPRRAARGKEGAAPTAIPAGPAADLAVFMLAVALPLASALGVRAMGWEPCDWRRPEGQARALIAQAAFGAAGLALAALWLPARRRRAPTGSRPAAWWWATCAAGFWLVQVVLYTSVFTNVRAGLASGVTGSLGYWMAQHGVNRAGQPWFYYLMLAALYEFLPILLAGAAAIRFFLLRRGRAPIFVRFCAAWALAAVAAYSLAGEKMPWLLAHIALPLMLLGAFWAGGFVERVAGLSRTRAAAPALLALVPALFYALVHLPGAGLAAGYTPAEGRATADALRALAAGLILAWAFVRLRRSPRLPGAEQRCLLGAGALAVAAGLSLRTSFRLAYVHHELATEPLVYAHATPAVRRVAERAANLERAVGKGEAPVVVYDEENTWPFVWYFRHVRARPLKGGESAVALEAPLILCGDRLAGEIRPAAQGRYVEDIFPALWWPMEGYKRGLLSGARQLAADPGARRQLWRIAAFRDYPGGSFDEWPLRRTTHLFIRNEWRRAADEGVGGPAGGDGGAP